MTTKIHFRPRMLVALDEFPLNKNGKLDRAALPEPTASAETAGGPGAPRGGFEDALVALYEPRAVLSPAAQCERDVTHCAAGGEKACGLARQVRRRAGARRGGALGRRQLLHARRHVAQGRRARAQGRFFPIALFLFTD